MRHDLRLLAAEVTVFLLIAVCLARQQHANTKNNPAALLLPNGTIVMKPVERGCKFSDPIKYHVQADLSPRSREAGRISTDRTKNKRRSIDERISQCPSHIHNGNEGTPSGRRIWILAPRKPNRRKVVHSEESPNIHGIDDSHVVRQAPPAELLPTPEALCSIKNITIGNPNIRHDSLDGVDISKQPPESRRSPSISPPYQHSFKNASSGTSTTPQIDDSEGNRRPSPINRLNLLDGLSALRQTHANPHCSIYEAAISGEPQHNNPQKQPSFLDNPGRPSNFYGNIVKSSRDEHSDTIRMSCADQIQQHTNMRTNPSHSDVLNPSGVENFTDPLHNDYGDNVIRNNLICNRRMTSESARNPNDQHKPEINTIKGQLDASLKCTPILRCWCSPMSGITGNLKSISNRAYRGCTCYDPSWISPANSSRKVDHSFNQMKTPPAGPVMAGDNYESKGLPASKNYQKFGSVAQNDIDLEDLRPPSLCCKVNPMDNVNYARRVCLYQNEVQRGKPNDNVCKDLDDCQLHHDRLQRSPKDMQCHSFRRHLPGFPLSTVPPFFTCQSSMPAGKRRLDFSSPIIGMTSSYGASMPSLYPVNRGMIPTTLAVTSTPIACPYSGLFANSAPLRANPFCKTGPVIRNALMPCLALPIQIAPTAEPPCSCHNFPINYWPSPLSQFSDGSNEISSFTTFVLDDKNMWWLIHQEFT